VEGLAQADPGNAGWKRDLSVSYSKIGDVLVAQGNLPEAMRYYRDGLALVERLANADPGNARWQSDLPAFYSKIGAVLRAQGRLPEALKSLPRQPRHRGATREGRSRQRELAA
jgi:tetratricopeptide (TPR) repeat protein